MNTCLFLTCGVAAIPHMQLKIIVEAWNSTHDVATTCVQFCPYVSATPQFCLIDFKFI